MDLTVFKPKTPVTLSAQIRRDVLGGEFSGAVLTNRDGTDRRYFTAGFSIQDLENLGIHEPTQLSLLRSMDDAGSIDLVTLESDPEHIGFLMTTDLHNVIHNATDAIGKLKDAAWTIFEIKDAMSETPFEGELKPLINAKGDVFRVSFYDLQAYFEHVVETGELMSSSFKKEDKSMSDTTKDTPNYTDEELQQLLFSSNSKSMDMTVEKKKSLDEQMFEEGEEYLQQQLKKEQEAAERERQRRIEEAKARKEREARARRQQEQAAAVKPATPGAIHVPNLKSFQEILDDLNIKPTSDVQRYYLSNLELLMDYAESMKIDAKIFNAFDPQGRRDLMIAMNSEREKFVSQAVGQLRREALKVEQQIEVDSEDANVNVREKHLTLYVDPLEARQQEMREKLDQFSAERHQALDDGFADWWDRVQDDPESVYREIYQQSVVDDAIAKEKDRLSQEYAAYREERMNEVDDYIQEFVETRRERDISHLSIDWTDASQLGIRTLNDRVESARSQMDTRRMMAEMRKMQSEMERRMRESNQAAVQQSDEPQAKASHTSRPEGTIQQERPEPEVKAAMIPERKVETPAQEPIVKAVPTPPVERAVPQEDLVKDVVPEDDELVDDSYDESYESPEPVPTEDYEDQAYEDQDQPEEEYYAPEPVIARPQDMYPQQQQQTYADDDWGDASLDDLDDTEEDYEDDDFGDDDLDDSEVEDKPRKKGLRGLFGKR